MYQLIKIYPEVRKGVIGEFESYEDALNALKRESGRSISSSSSRRVELRIEKVKEEGLGLMCSHCSKGKPATNNTEVGALCGDCYKDACDGGL